MAGALFKVEWDDAQVSEMLQRLIEAGRNIAPLMHEIGSELEHSSRERVKAGGPAPDGTPWAPLAASTLARKTTGKPLIERGDLLNSIRYEAGADFVQIIAGPTEYAAVHQGGSAPYVIKAKNGKALAFEIGGKRIARRKVNHPGVPARPFIGVSSEDRASIIDAGLEFLARAAR